MTSALELLRPSSVARAQLPRCKAVELRALRESFRRAAEELAGPVVTALYVLIRPDQDPAARLALARAAAGRAGYAVAKVHAVETPRTRGGVRRPATRTAGGA
ncbi:hypothetical protein [Streptomyces lunaelactis]|uniref:hypothetical protein n=1 Tax=Streptomyces lunaelactis TaxID=1535768 RepID=UPI0015853E9F|nr:hypothetical protein [Streptomyces lunaelactis]NUK15667.1 hypothetical protein [Streptomyces lunaelactis]